MRSLNIRSNERIIGVGRTGSGKTVLAKYIVRNWPSLVVYDEKAEITLTNAHITSDIRQIANADVGRFVYRPPIEAIANNKARKQLLEDFFRVIYERKNTVLYIDEIYAVAENAQSFPYWLRAILTRGRSRNIGVIALTQRPAFIPNFFISEAEHIFTFNLSLEQDQTKMAFFIGDQAYAKLPQYAFRYVNMITDQSGVFRLQKGKLVSLD